MNYLEMDYDYFVCLNNPNNLFMTAAPQRAPEEVRCTTLTSQSIHVTWAEPPATSVNGILKGYKISYRLSSQWFGG